MRQPRRSRQSRRRGQALFLVVLLSVGAMAIGLAVSSVALLNSDVTRAGMTGDHLAYAARSGIGQANFLLWTRYNNYVTNNLLKQAPGNITDFRGYLAPSLLVPARASTGTLETATPGTNDLQPGETMTLCNLQLPVGAVSGQSLRGNTVWVRVTAERQDTGLRDTYVVLRSEATLWDTVGGTVTPAMRAAAQLPSDRSVVEQVLHFEGPPFEGFQFVLLANAINCTFCHARLDNTDRIYNTNPANYGTYQRVKVASLENLEMRTGSHTGIAGTLYVQGTLVDAAGNVMNPATHAAFTGGSGLKSVDLDSTGKIVESTAASPYSRTTGENFVDLGTTVQNSNFYKNYPTDPALQIDGVVPDKFPPVVPDDNNNRAVDDTEWTDYKTNKGTFTGTLAGGTTRNLYNKDGSSPLTGTSLPTGGTATVPPGGTAGQSVVIIGTTANPILIDGDVAIDGDVVISGVIKGKGSIVARGNMYVMGDLTYADDTSSGNRTFGVAQDGTENLVAYAAGGNIVHGAYLTARNGPAVTGEGDENGGNPNWEAGWGMQEIAWWNRTEWTRAMPYFDAAKGMPTAHPTNGSGTANPANSGYIPGYKPRFYTYKENGKVWFYGPDKGKADYQGRATEWNNTLGHWVGDGNGHVYAASRQLNELFGPTMTGTGGASLVADFMSGTAYTTMALDPKWISQSDFRAMQLNADVARKSANGGTNRPYQLDGLFYTNNAMIFMSRNRSFSSSGGQMEFNGSVVAADTGILGGKGSGGSGSGADVKIFYDQRTRNHFTVEDTTEVSIALISERESK
jgi:hypothetical protein